MDDSPLANGHLQDEPGGSPQARHLPADSLGRAYADTLRLDAAARDPEPGGDGVPGHAAPAELAPDVSDPTSESGVSDGAEPAPEHATPDESGAHETSDTGSADEPAESSEDRSDRPDVTERVQVSAKSILEAMLFVGGEPLSAERACDLIRGMNKEKLRRFVAELNAEYEAHGRPFEIWDENDGLVLQVKDEFIPAIRRLHRRRREATLSRAALEALAVVAYQQPVGRQDIETIRGVGCAAHVRMLLARGLIRVVERAESGGHGARYGTTDRFLDLFNLRSIDDLPRIDDLDRL